MINAIFIDSALIQDPAPEEAQGFSGRGTLGGQGGGTMYNSVILGGGGGQPQKRGARAPPGPPLAPPLPGAYSKQYGMHYLYW